MKERQLKTFKISLWLHPPQAVQTSVDHVSAATAAVITDNLKLLASMILPEHPVTCADAESYMVMLQVVWIIPKFCFCAGMLLLVCVLDSLIY